MGGPNEILEPQRQDSLPTYTDGVIPGSGVIVYPAEDSGETSINALGLARYADGETDRHPGEFRVANFSRVIPRLIPLSSTWHR